MSGALAKERARLRGEVAGRDIGQRLHRSVERSQIGEEYEQGSHREVAAEHLETAPTHQHRGRRGAHCSGRQLEAQLGVDRPQIGPQALLRQRPKAPGFVLLAAEGLHDRQGRQGLLRQRQDLTLELFELVGALRQRIGEAPDREGERNHHAHRDHGQRAIQLPHHRKHHADAGQCGQGGEADPDHQLPRAQRIGHHAADEIAGRPSGVKGRREALEVIQEVGTQCEGDAVSDVAGAGDATQHEEHDRCARQARNPCGDRHPVARFGQPPKRGRGRLAHEHLIDQQLHRPGSECGEADAHEHADSERHEARRVRAGVTKQGSPPGGHVVSPAENW